MKLIAEHERRLSQKSQREIAAAFLLIAIALFHALAQQQVREPVVVDANRSPNADSSRPFSLTEIDELHRAPELRLDKIPRAGVPRRFS